jgi:hypothetical protein
MDRRALEGVEKGPDAEKVKFSVAAEGASPAAIAIQARSNKFTTKNASLAAGYAWNEGITGICKGLITRWIR